ncbi:MAG: Mandelate racemase/muconate lactonizing enzyme-like protein [Xanthobacteraceae bacterium]|jgi:L-alanine-DL-glutamate epimerase-like enolase superfamily enzyme|nr:Mandelate racemase/muconate lactonizing enzyme-like protein [Xanthobacteraceae bacterium]
MRITDLTVTQFEQRDIRKLTFGPHNAPTAGTSTLGLVTISTDAGLEGHAFLGSITKSSELDALSLVQTLKPILLGRDPLDREALHQAICKRFRSTTWRCIGAVDVALWDLAGKIAGLPIYRLIGGHRAAVPAYASSPGHVEISEYVEEALETKARGYHAYKIHPPRKGWHGDIEVCAAVRKAVGDDYRLMLDSTWMYTYTEAVRVGRAIEEMGFYWFEDPLAEEDIYNSAKLRQKLDIPILATEFSPGGFHAYAPWIIAQATDYLRGDVAVKGGITACVKAAHLAEAFRMTFEIHHGGNSLNNVANLHIMCGISNSEFFEVILPDDVQKYGLVNDLVVDQKGMVRVPDSPGLGVEIDFERIGTTTTAILR